MKPKKWAVFRADLFPDDTEETDTEIIRFPGENIAEALREILAGVGCERIGEPSEEAEHGWHVHFRSNSKPFWLQVSRIEPETLLLFDKSYGSDGLFYKGPSRHEQLLEKIRAALATDGRFGELRWYTQEEMDTVDWNLPLEPAAATGPEADA
ncbi:MAG: hypothetical protein JWP86_131 [Phenylobacterium sp.]|nr:hypothetical protein [Phenylobacterium sp.]